MLPIIFATPCLFSPLFFPSLLIHGGLGRTDCLLRYDASLRLSLQNGRGVPILAREGQRSTWTKLAPTPHRSIIAVPITLFAYSASCANVSGLRGEETFGRI